MMIQHRSGLDTTIDDIHRVRKQMAAKFGGDLNAILEDAQTPGSIRTCRLAGTIAKQYAFARRRGTSVKRTHGENVELPRVRIYERRSSWEPANHNTHAELEAGQAFGG